MHAPPHLCHLLAYTIRNMFLYLCCGSTPWLKAKRVPHFYQHESDESAPKVATAAQKQGGKEGPSPSQTKKKSHRSSQSDKQKQNKLVSVPRERERERERERKRKKKRACTTHTHVRNTDTDTHVFECTRDPYACETCAAMWEFIP